MKDAFRVPHPTQEELAAEWDALASLRRRQILSGVDVTYRKILTPAMLDLVPMGKTRILDVGCGTGEFTAELANLAAEVVGIDPSKESIRLARELHGHIEALTFYEGSIEHFASHGLLRGFDVVTAHMVIMDSLDLASFVRGVRQVARSGGTFVLSSIHPWFWPVYWGYASEPWFRYSEEICVRARFRLSLETTDFYATHFHRPLSMYFGAFREAGFELQAFREPLPGAEAERLYGQVWDVPRYMLASLKAVPVRGMVG